MLSKKSRDHALLRSFAKKLPLIPGENHYKNLKKAYGSEGFDGVNKYIDGLVMLANKNNQSDEENSIPPDPTE